MGPSYGNDDTLLQLTILIIVINRLASLYTSQSRKQKQIECKIVNVFLSISLIICFGCSKEPSH